jgi:hypothetical protein
VEHAATLEGMILIYGRVASFSKNVVTKLRVVAVPWTIVAGSGRLIDATPGIAAVTSNVLCSGDISAYRPFSVALEQTLLPDDAPLVTVTVRVAELALT